MRRGNPRAPGAGSAALRRLLRFIASFLCVAPLLCFAAEPVPPRYSGGAASFQANCAVCHGAKGAGQPSLAPPLLAYPARYAANPEGRRQLTMTVLNGMFGGIDVEQKHYDFKMPDFAHLDDVTLAEVLNFVVFDLAHAAKDTQPLTAQEIAAERSHPVDGAAVREHRTKLLSALGL
ncbi:MAG: cytochrome [Gammaproteobacteria bacterium]|nr:cytochrome [Gammaproteobacteria bacterium]